MTPATGRIHVLLIALLGGVVLFINASSSDNPLRAQDRDLFALLRADHPDLLRGLELRSPAWGPLPLARLAAMDLSGLDLRALRISGTALRDVKLKGSHLEQAAFHCVPMQNVDLSGANLREAHFDYSHCGASQLLQAEWNGADLSQANLQGGVLKNGECESHLTLKGNLNGVKFEKATLQCIKLINTAATTPAFPSSPQYAGINFVQSDINHLGLIEGDFVFSDFYRAQLSHLAFAPRRADLRFSTLAELRCPRNSNGCEIKLDGERNPNPRLSLNVRGSQIISNLQLPNTTAAWPALLCDPASRFQAMGASSSAEGKGTGFWIVAGDGARCAPPQSQPIR